MPAGSKSRGFDLHWLSLNPSFDRFVFITESYGDHYAPAFITYFNEQNDKIAQGTLDAEPIVVKAMLTNK